MLGGTPGGARERPRRVQTTLADWLLQEQAEGQGGDGEEDEEDEDEEEEEEEEEGSAALHAEGGDRDWHSSEPSPIAPCPPAPQ